MTGLPHPSWCDPAQCTADEPATGCHRSAPRRIDSPSYGHPTIDLYWWAPGFEPASEGERHPGVVMALTMADGSWVTSVETYEVTAGQLRALAGLARAVADQTDAAGQPEGGVTS